MSFFLSAVPRGAYTIEKIKKSESSQRLLELGFLKGTKLFVHRISPFGKTILVENRKTLYSLRSSLASHILVKYTEEK